MRFVKSVFLCLFLLTSFVSPVLAATVTGGNVINFADTVVPVDATMNTVIVVGGNAYISGNVQEDVVVIDGNAELSSTANIRERVVVLGGNLETEQGAFIGKGVFHVGGNFKVAATLVSTGLLMVLLGFVKIAVTVAIISIPVILAWFWQARVQEISAIIQTNPVKTVVVGFLGGLAVVILGLILSITLIGIPLAFIIIFAAVAISLLGLGGVCCALGQILPLKVPARENGTIFNTLYGAVLLALFFNVPFIGIAAFKLSLLIAFGAVIIKLSLRKLKS